MIGHRTFHVLGERGYVGVLASNRFQGAVDCFGKRAQGILRWRDRQRSPKETSKEKDERRDRESAFTRRGCTTDNVPQPRGFIFLVDPTHARQHGGDRKRSKPRVRARRRDTSLTGPRSLMSALAAC